MNLNLHFKHPRLCFYFYFQIHFAARPLPAQPILVQAPQPVSVTTDKAVEFARKESTDVVDGGAKDADLTAK